MIYSVGENKLFICRTARRELKSFNQETISEFSFLTKMYPTAKIVILDDKTFYKRFKPQLIATGLF